ncbi:MAG: metallophosphoesterase family protein [Ectothiorhodospiraceae bacterium]|nr:metallophosphoesterase family protein [Ectothiorhodospiraceae bacterium]
MEAVEEREARFAEEAALVRYLAGRWEPEQIRARLALERGGAEPVFDRHGRFHPENSVLVLRLLQLGLRATGLYDKGRRNARRLRLRRRRLRLPGLPRPLHGVRILHLSDLHLDMHPEFPAVLRERLRSLEYELCVITGDFRYQTWGSSEPALAAVARIMEVIRAPVYCVLGNHDPLGMVPELERMGLRVLLNEAAVWTGRDVPLAVAGIDDPHYFRLHDPVQARAGIPAEVPALLLSHSPEPYQEAADAGYQALLCGHTHGGQICLPGGAPLVTNARCPRRYCRGAWTYGDLRGYTTAGVGASVMDVRFNCPPELILHILAPAGT